MAQWFNDLACLCRGTRSIPSLVQWLKHLVLPYLWHRSQMHLRFSPWPGKFHMLRVQPRMGRRGGKQNYSGQFSY